MVPSQNGMILKSHFHKDWQRRVIRRWLVSIKKWHGPLISLWILIAEISLQSLSSQMCRKNIFPN
uniref:Uncharacterized protein n=1 Tax=Vombatus ursinus TaxID=29139 RepID=A0A4X2L6U1_VOMUR